MKQFRNLLLFIPLAFGIVSCDTDDLKKDIDDLKDRVTNLEAQVQIFNENLNALRVLTQDDAKTIKNWSLDQATGKYTIELSDGQTIVLTQGVKGTAPTPPDIRIGADGYWYINDQKQPVKAEAPTPEFRVTSGGYWQVDLDGKDATGHDFKDVTDEQGNPVKATTSNEINMEDQFFKSVSEKNGFLVVEVKGYDKPIKLPIDADLVCEIVRTSITGLKDDVLTVGNGMNVEFTVKVKGERYAVTAPAGWTAILGEPSSETNEATLKLIAPAQSSTLSRATADNTTDLTLQVNNGVNWAVDKIKVEAKQLIESYYQEYLKGKDLVIGKVGENTDNAFTLNKTTCPEDMVVHIEADQEITDDNKVYFVKEGVTVTYNVAGNITSLIVVGDKPGVMSTIKTTKIMSLTGETSGKGLIMYNMVLDASQHTNYVVNINKEADDIEYDYLYLIDKCRIKLPTAGKNFAYVNNKPKVSVKTILMCNTYVNAQSTGNPIMTSYSNNGYKLKNVIMYNNVFYSPQSGSGIEKFGILAAPYVESNIEKLYVENNTFINLLGSNVYAKAIIKGNLDVKNNLIWNDVSSSVNTYLVQALKNSDLSSVSGDNYSGNKVYSKNSLKNFVFHTSGDVPAGLAGNNLSSEATDPFTGGKMLWNEGVFVPGPGYETVGAHID